MIRINKVILMGINTTDFVGREPVKEQNQNIQLQNGKTLSNFVLNFRLACYDAVDKRSYQLPVCVWDEELIDTCERKMKEGMLIYVEGSLRYKYLIDELTEKVIKIYTTVKAEKMEFIDIEGLPKHKVPCTNSIRLIGKLADTTKLSESGDENLFSVQVERNIPKQVLSDVDEGHDMIPLLVKDKKAFTGSMKKGSLVVVDGRIMTRKKTENMSDPRIVVNVNSITSLTPLTPAAGSENELVGVPSLMNFDLGE